MSMDIRNQDVNYVETNNNVSIRTDVPKAHLEDGSLILRHARRMRLPADTDIKVSVMNHTRDILLHTAMFSVWKAVASHKRIEADDGSEKSVVQIDYRIRRVGEWWDSPAAEVTEADLIAAQKPTDPPGETKWNPGKQAYEIVVAGEVRETVIRNEGEAKEEYKARALAIAAGTDPLPEAKAA